MRKPMAGGGTKVALSILQQRFRRIPARAYSILKYHSSVVPLFTGLSKQTEPVHR